MQLIWVEMILIGKGFLPGFRNSGGIIKGPRKDQVEVDEQLS